MSNLGIKMVRKLVWAAALILALAPLSAGAATLAFSFETQDGVFSGSGDLTISNSLDSAGGYDVTGISGTLSGPNGGAMTLVANPNQPAASTDNSGSWYYDNVVYTSGSWFDNAGLLFTAGIFEYNLFTVGSDYILSSHNPQGSFSGQAVDRLTLTAIPEPATWLMMGLGFVALGLGGGRAARRNRAAFA